MLRCKVEIVGGYYTHSYSSVSKFGGLGVNAVNMSEIKSFNTVFYEYIYEFVNGTLSPNGRKVHKYDYFFVGKIRPKPLGFVKTCAESAGFACNDFFEINVVRGGGGVVVIPTASSGNYEVLDQIRVVI